MSRTNSKSTNQKQFRLLVDFMKEYPDIAKNITDKSFEVLQDLWSNLQRKLNYFGPPVKDIAQWKKVWCDYKSYLRKKLRQEKKINGSNKNIVFTSLEEEVIELLCLRECIEEISNTVFPDGQTFFSDSYEIIDNARARPKRKCESFLEEWVDYQQELQSVSSIVSHQSDKFNKKLYSKRMCGVLEKLYDQKINKNKILQDQLNESIRHNRCMEKLAMEKNKIKAKLIGIELAKLQFRNS